VQSLLLINNRQLLERSQTLAQRVERAEPSLPKAQIRLLYQLLYSRQPSADELTEAEYFLQEQAPHIPVSVPSNTAVIVETMPQREGKAVVLAPRSPQERLVTTGVKPLAEDFTVESVVLLRSIYEGGEIRTIASDWTGDRSKPGWSLGITGGQSQRKPQMLVMQLAGASSAGTTTYEAVFSDLQIQLGRSYYLAASVHYAANSAGAVTFYLKDLTNDDEPLQTTVVPHPMAHSQPSEAPFTIGARAGNGIQHQWDGLIDEVRVSAGPLAAEACFYQRKEAALPSAVISCWQFEPMLGMLTDTRQQRENLLPPSTAPKNQLHPSAMADLCHAMLNSNEFLYVR
jgi:hypothetical protein